MHASRTDYSRMIDYSAVVKFDGMRALQGQIVRRIQKRRGGMTFKQLQKWFHATPKGFLRQAVGNCINACMVYQGEGTSVYKA